MTQAGEAGVSPRTWLPPGVGKPGGTECVAAGAAILLRRNPPWRSRAQDREGLSPDSI